jgi:nucleoside-diphosphate-sugar epimerase
MNESKPAVLVTGATGFVGSNLVRKLIGKGYAVTCLVRSTSKTRVLETLPVKLLIADLENPASIRSAVQGIETVYHVAGAIKAANREGFLRINKIGTRRLLETLAENSGIQRFIHVSSLAAAGPSRDGIALTEEQAPSPISWYGESKLESEKEVLRFSRNFKVAVLRPSAVYGPNDRETLLIFRMIKRGCLFTPGRFIRRFSLIHVEDLSDALICAGEKDIPSGEVFFVSREETYTWDEVGQAIARALGKRYRRVAFPSSVAKLAGFAGDLWAGLSGQPTTVTRQKVRELLQPCWLCNPAKARRLLEFTPQIDLDTGIRNTTQWYRDQEWL